MPTVSIDEVEPGAILARPIEDSMGRVLISSGEPLTEQLINVLRKRGYAEVDIRRVEPPRPSEELEARITKTYVKDINQDPDILEVKSSIENRFHNFADKDQFPLMHKFYLVAQNVLVDRVLKKKGLR